MKTSAVEDYWLSKEFILSGSMMQQRVWNAVHGMKGSFYLMVRAGRHGDRHTTVSMDTMLDAYYGKPLYKLRVYPKLPLR